MNILPFHLNVPAEITLERPEGTLVQGRYGDRVMFSLADGRVMYVPPFVALKIQAEGVAPGERFQLCKTRVKNGGRRSIEWIVRRLDPFEELVCATALDSLEAPRVPDGSSDTPAAEPEPETPLERDLRASIEFLAANGNAAARPSSHLPVAADGNGDGHQGPHPNSQSAPPTKLEHALKTAISAAYNAERFGAELGYVVRFDADAIKAMAITVLINMSERSPR